MRSSIFLLGLVLAVLVAGVDSASAWTKRIAGVESLDDELRDVASDAAGDLIVAEDHSVSKHARVDGAELWRTRVVDVVDTVNTLSTVAIDAAGDVVVTGIVADFATPTDVLVVKLSGADGRELWRYRFNGPGNSADYGIDITVDANDDVIVGGVSHLIAEDMLALKVDGRTGEKKWHAVVPGPGVGQDQGLAVAVDANGDVAVAGDSTVGTVDRFAVIKVRGSDGKLLWRGTAGTGNENGQATAVVFDPAGDVIVMGSIAFAATGFDVAVVKFDGATGAERWHRYVDGVAHDFDFGSDLAVDASGRIAALGRVVNEGTGNDLVVLRLEADGAEAWRRVIDGGASGYDVAEAVAIVGDRVVVTAGIDGTTFDDTRFAALGLDAATGVEVWRRVRDGEAGGRDRATRVAAGTGGRVFVAGRLANVGSKDDGLVLDLDAASGVKQWDLTLNATVPDPDDRAQAVAVDANGAAIVSGTVGTRRKAEDFTVVKLAPSGAEAWRTRIDGLLHADDVGGPVVIEPAGDVFAAGTTLDGPGLPPTDPRFPGYPPVNNVTIVRLDGATGTEEWRSAPDFGRRGLGPVATDLALAGADVVVGGWFGTLDYDCRSAVVKLRGADGVELWRRLYFFDVLPEDPVEVEVDGAGDVVAAAQTHVEKLRGTDGGTVWGPRFGELLTRAMALDAQGDVVLAGTDGGGFAVEKIRGTNGTTAWTASLGLGRALAVRVDTSGDVLAAGVLDVGGGERLAVVKLDGAGGATLWTRLAPGRAPARGLTLALDAAGDVVVGGAASMPGRGEDLAILKLRGDSGRIRWRRQVDGGAREDDRAQAIAIDPAGNPLAAGVLRGIGSGDDFAVVRFDGRSGRFR